MEVKAKYCRPEDIVCNASPEGPCSAIGCKAVQNADVSALRSLHTNVALSFTFYMLVVLAWVPARPLTNPQCVCL